MAEKSRLWRHGAVVPVLALSAFVALACVPAPAAADERSSPELVAHAPSSADEWKYEIMRDEDGDNYVQILRYLGNAEVPVVPGTIEGVPVTQVYYLSNTAPSIAALDVSGCTELQGLVCVSAGLRSIDLSKNAKLETLNLSRNALVELDLSANGELRELDCDSNELTSLSIAGNAKLVRLICNDNRIADVSSLEKWAAGGAGRTSQILPQRVDGHEPARQLREYSGEDRYDVSRQIIAAELGNDVYRGVIVVSGEDGKFADALSAGALSGMLNYPVMLTEGDQLSSECYDALKWLTRSISGALDIVVVGGPSTVSDAVVEQLGEYGSVTRVGGTDRYELSRNVYEFGAARSSWNEEYVVVAKGNDFPDALAIAPYASSRMVPVLLVDSDAPSVDAATSSLMGNHGRAVVLGGERSVSPAVFSQIESLMAKGAQRIGGADRFEAALNIAQWEISQGMSLQGVGFSTAYKFTDALSSGFLLGQENSVLLLLDGLDAGSNEAVREFLGKNASDVTAASVFGGPHSISQDVRDSIFGSMGW